MKDNGGAAFPTPYLERDGDVFTTCFESGMSLRDWFAGKALQGLCCEHDEAGAILEKGGAWIANEAYRIADAMLARKDK